MNSAGISNARDLADAIQRLNPTRISPNPLDLLPVAFYVHDTDLTWGVYGHPTHVLVLFGMCNRADVSIVLGELPDYCLLRCNSNHFLVTAETAGRLAAALGISIKPTKEPE